MSMMSVSKRSEDILSFSAQTRNQISLKTKTVENQEEDAVQDNNAEDEYGFEYYYDEEYEAETEEPVKALPFAALQSESVKPDHEVRKRSKTNNLETDSMLSSCSIDLKETI